MPSELVIARSVQSALGPDALSSLLDALHTVDCQTCGERCGPDDELALAVDDSGLSVAFAALHHSDCRKSEWRHLSAVGIQQVNYHVTWRARCFPRAHADLPLVLVNPSCEMATLRLDGRWRRHWRVSTLDQFSDSGFSTQAGVAALTRPVPMLRAEVSPDQVSVEVPDNGHLTTWTCKIASEVYAKALERERIIVGVTSRADPTDDEIGEERLSELIRLGAVACACVAVSRAEPETGAEDPDAVLRLMAKKENPIGHGTQRPELVRDHTVAAMTLGDVSTRYSRAYTAALVKTSGLRDFKHQDRARTLAIYIAMHCRDCWTHVLLPDPDTALDYEKIFRSLNEGFAIFTVARVTGDCEPGPQKATIGTYAEFAAAGSRLERALPQTGDLKVLGLAIDPGPGFAQGQAPLAFTRHYTRLIEV